MIINRRSFFPLGVCLLLFALLLSACRPADPSLELGMEESNDLMPEEDQEQPVADPTEGLSLSSPPPPASAAAGVLPPLELFILHTNDTWGYHDPCG